MTTEILHKMLNGERVEFGQEDYAQRDADTTAAQAAINGMQARALAEYMQEFRDLRRELLNVLVGIALAEDLQAEFRTMRQALLDIPQSAAVIAATTATEAKAAIKTEYARIVRGASPALVSAFKEIDQ